MGTYFIYVSLLATFLEADISNRMYPLFLCLHGNAACMAMLPAWQCYLHGNAARTVSTACVATPGSAGVSPAFCVGNIA
jgi:hypothetical protein